MGSVISNVNHQVAADPPLFVNVIGQQINQHNPAQTTELSGLMDPLLPGQKSQRSHNVPKLLQLQLQLQLSYGVAHIATN